VETGLQPNQSKGVETEETVSTVQSRRRQKKTFNNNLFTQRKEKYSAVTSLQEKYMTAGRRIRYTYTVASSGKVHWEKYRKGCIIVYSENRTKEKGRQ
jgi:hypothetical protein